MTDNQIISEKQEIKEGYKKTKLGWIPEEWEVVKMRKHVNLLSGFAFKSKKYSENPSDFRLLRGDNIMQGFFRWTNAKYWKKDSTENLERYFLDNGDVVIAMDRTLVSNGLKVAVVKNKDLPSLLVQRVCRIRAKIGLEQSILQHLFSSNRFEIYVKSVQKESAVPHISLNQIRDFIIPLPSLPEQKKIAQILSTWDKAIDLTQQLIEQLTTRKKGLMQQLLTGQVRLRGFSGEWEEVRIGHVTTNFSRRNKKLIDARVYSVTNTDGFIYQSDMFAREVASTDLSNYKIIQKDEFAYNPARINVGSIAFFEDEVGIISSLYVCFKTNESLENYFLFYLLQTDELKHKISTFGEGGVRVYLWYPLLKSIKIKIPSITEQKALVSIIKNCDKEIDTQKAYLKALQNQKKGLMQQLLAGQKRVNINK